jgi:hypothetical protein
MLRDFPALYKFLMEPYRSIRIDRYQHVISTEMQIDFLFLHRYSTVFYNKIIFLAMI